MLLIVVLEIAAETLAFGSYFCSIRVILDFVFVSAKGHLPFILNSVQFPVKLI